MIDRRKREAILTDDKDVIVTAGAGAGKTTILTQKIIKDIEKNKKHYKIAAITFTKKAAKEIKEKLLGKATGHFIGTNDSFIEQEIIRPFIKDAFGYYYNGQFEVVYNTNKFNSFEEGLELLRNHNKLGTYNDNKKNFKFELARQILVKSTVARQYIQSRYFKLYIDEYQDCDKYMNELFMYINNFLNIKLFIVGDSKQAIYQWRGAEPKIFKQLASDEKNGFNKYELRENFRCCNQIQNYSNLLERKNNDYYIKCNDFENIIGVLDSKKVWENIDLNMETAILLRYAKWGKVEIARDLEKMLKNKGYNFVYIPRTPLDDLGTENTFILIELAKYIKNPNYTIYDLLNELPFELSKLEIDDIRKNIKKLKSSDINKELIYCVLNKIFYILNLSFKGLKEVEIFSETILNNLYDNAYNGKEYKYKIMTIHSSKGLEFEQVVIFSNDFKLHQGKDNNEHYVATTRAKNRLIVDLENQDYLQHIENLVKRCGIESIEKIIKIV